MFVFISLSFSLFLSLTPPLALTLIQSISLALSLSLSLALTHILQLLDCLFKGLSSRFKKIRDVIDLETFDHNVKNLAKREINWIKFQTKQKHQTAKMEQNFLSRICPQGNGIAHSRFPPSHSRFDYQHSRFFFRTFWCCWDLSTEALFRDSWKCKKFNCWSNPSNTSWWQASTTKKDYVSTCGPVVRAVSCLAGGPGSNACSF